MRVGGEQNLSHPESPQKPLTDSQSYDSKEEQLACVCSSVRLNPSAAWVCGLMTRVQSLRFCAVAALGCQCYCCLGVQLYSGVITQAKDGWSCDEHISFLLCYNDIKTPNYTETAHVSLSVSIATTRHGKRWCARDISFAQKQKMNTHTHTQLQACTPVAVRGDAC